MRISIDAETYGRLEARAQREGRTVDQVAEDLLRRVVEDLKGPHPERVQEIIRRSVARP